MPPADPLRTTRRLMAAKALRAFGDGFVALLLPAWLLELGYSAWEVGLVATVTLFGSGVMTLLVGTQARRFELRTLLLAACALMAATGLALANVSSLWPLLLVAFVGTVNPSAGDVSVFLPLEHALLSSAAPGRSRTGVFARYALVGTVAAAVGSLAAGLPALLPSLLGATPRQALQAMFVLYALLALGSAALYRGLPRRTAAAQAAPAHEALGPSRKRVYTLAALFGLDAFGGGFVVQSLLALWLYQRFGLPVHEAGAIFFWTGLLSALSFLAAARIANRIGLVRTMVWTHLPANLCLVALPFCDSLGLAMALLFVRSALSQMDVPTRSAYVMGIVTPAERPAAASVTSVPRSFAAAASPALAGWMLAGSSFGWPLLVGGALKIAYDLLLLAMFSRVKPAEEEGP